MELELLGFNLLTVDHDFVEEVLKRQLGLLSDNLVEVQIHRNLKKLVG